MGAVLEQWSLMVGHSTLQREYDRIFTNNMTEIYTLSFSTFVYSLSHFEVDLS